MFYEKFLLPLQNMVRADIFQVLWQFGMFAAKPPHRPFFARAARGGAGPKTCSSYFQYTPPVGISQARGSRLASLGGQFVFIFRQKRKGFIN